MNQLKNLSILLLFCHSVQTAEKPTISNETDKNQKVVFYNARFYEKGRPIKTPVTIAPNQSMLIPWEKAYEEGGPLIYDIQKIELYKGKYLVSELPIDTVNRALLSQGIVYVAIEPNVKSEAKLVLALTKQGKEEYLELSDQGKKNFSNLEIRTNLTPEEIKKYVKKEVQRSTPLPSPLAGIISEYASPQEPQSKK